MISGVTTRAQKRRMGERELWSLIVKNDDICFKHILPRLNGTDIKFLYEVNTETRKLIKRSPRERDLRNWFSVSEMSSISTLEVVWENKSLWWSWWNETYFCWKVAETNKFKLLKRAREEKKCEWNGWTSRTAVRKGNLEMVKRHGILGLPNWRLEMVIFIYSNILLSVNMINITDWRVRMRPRKATWTV